MKIALLGWGSLIWNKGDLKIVEKHWNEDGPMLPIEFARMSTGGRLTLVIKPNWKQVTVLYSTSEFTELDAAIENLQIREGTPAERIGFYNFQTGDKNIREANIPILENLIYWNKNQGFDAIIWTDLPPNFRDKLNLVFNLENVSHVLKNLNPADFDSAREYIEKAPQQVETLFRGEIEKIVQDIQRLKETSKQ